LYDRHAVTSSGTGVAVADRRIAIIGVGNMGGRISRRILAAGYELVGYDRDPRPAESAGVPLGDSIEAVVADADVVLLSLPDSSVVEAVVLGERGVLASSRPGQTVVDLSTAAPSSTVKLHAELAARGVELLDAGISGGAAAAEQGTLSIMAGGSEEALERVRWLLETFSARVYYMGPSGAGHTTKLLNNFLNGVSLAATAEVMVAARKAGLDLGTFLDVVNHSSGVNFATLNRFPHIIEGDYLEGGLTGNLMMKDLLLYVDLARELGVPALNAAGCVATFGLAAGLGYGEQISNRVVDALGDVAGGVRLHGEPAMQPAGRADAR
jgi:3-hydroxyisobutyrate dehydrogenase-like beta-hydroxyacid dehydrogenase